MPLPIPAPGESERDFIGRCMSDEGMVSEFPDASQRAAVCYGQWREPVRGQAARSEADAIEARVAIPLAQEAGAPEWIMWMPGGRHTITGSKNGRPITVEMEIGPEDAARMQRALQAHLARRHKPFFDFAHEGKGASAWPLEFAWRETPEPGIWARVEWSEAGRQAVAGRVYRAFSPMFFESSDRPARVEGAPLNMGGLVNNPAFAQIAPLWASAGPTTPTMTMNATDKVELAALQARIAELEAQNAELKARAESPEREEALRAAQAELEAAKAQLDNLKAELAARARRDAETIVASAVARGAIAAKDEVAQKRWIELIVADPKNAELLNKLPGKPALTAGRMTPQGSGIQVLKPDVCDALRGYIAAANPTERGLIYYREFKPLLDKGERIPFERYPVEAANTLGTMIGNLIAQRILDLVYSRRPMLANVTTDFSDEPARKGQAIYTRTVAIPSAQDFGSGPQDTADTDYVVSLAHHREVHYAFTTAEYLSTNRNLVEEHAQAQAVGLGNALVDAVAALITNAFTNKSVGPASGKDFSALTTAAKALNAAGAPDFGRSMWVNADFAEALSNDQIIMEYLDGNNRTAYGHWMNVKGFEHVWEYPALPSNGWNLIGFAFQRSALLLVTRVADNPEALIGAGYPGSITVIRDPVSGLAVLSDRWIDQGTRRINMRLDVLYGAARGVINCGFAFVSQ